MINLRMAAGQTALLLNVPHSAASVGTSEILMVAENGSAFTSGKIRVGTLITKVDNITVTALDQVRWLSAPFRNSQQRFCL